MTSEMREAGAKATGPGVHARGPGQSNHSPVSTQQLLGRALADLLLAGEPIARQEACGRVIIEKRGLMTTRVRLDPVPWGGPDYRDFVGEHRRMLPKAEAWAYQMAKRWGDSQGPLVVVDLVDAGDVSIQGARR